MKESIRRMKDSEEDYTKFHLFHGHDMNLFNLFFVLKWSSYECLKKKVQGEVVPDTCISDTPFASSVVWELYQEDNGEFSVEFNFNGTPLDFCGLGNGQPCPFSKLEKVFKEITLEGENIRLRSKYCDYLNRDKDIKVGVLIGFVLTTIVVTVSIAFVYKKKTTN